DLHELLAAMAHFHDRHAAAVPIGHLGGCLLQDLERQDRRPRRKIPGPHQSFSPVSGLEPAPASSEPDWSGASPASGAACSADASSSPGSSSRSASLSTTRRTPDRVLFSSTLIRVTPWVARPISRISDTRVRTSTPAVVMSMISSAGVTSTAPTTLPLRAEVWMAIMPLVPRPWRVYSTMEVRLP